MTEVLPSQSQFNRTGWKISVFLNSFHIEIEGVILDRGFAVPAVFDSIESYGWKYVVMLPSDTYAHLQMMKEHADEIRWRSDYLLEDTAMFGIEDTRELFKKHRPESGHACFLMPPADVTSR